MLEPTFEKTLQVKVAFSQHTKVSRGDLLHWYLVWIYPSHRRLHLCTNLLWSDIQVYCTLSHDYWISRSWYPWWSL